MKLRIESGAIAGADTTFELDGVDLTRAVRGTDIHMNVGDLIDVTVDVVLTNGLSFEGDVARIAVPDESAVLLRRAGWLPPVHALGPLPSDVAERLRELHREYRDLTAD